MRCTTCGAESAGTFCTQCGAKVAPQREQPPAPGYWKASDGHWYPPTMAPAQLEPPRPAIPEVDYTTPRGWRNPWALLGIGAVAVVLILIGLNAAGIETGEPDVQVRLTSEDHEEIRAACILSVHSLGGRADDEGLEEVRECREELTAERLAEKRAGARD